MTSTEALRHYTRCRVCASTDIVTVMRLESTPLEDQFVADRDEARDAPVYPLELALCRGCGYVHLPHIVSPEMSYSDYAYVSTVSVGLTSHYDEYAASIAAAHGLDRSALAVDLGSNDGSMLNSFKKLGMRVVGVEPAAHIAKAANDAGLPTIEGFFNTEIAERIVEEHGSAAVVTANYVFANIEDVLQFTRDVARVLGPDGVFVVQTGYHPVQMQKKMFDYIYHEHFSYFTLGVVQQIFASCGLQVLAAEKVPTKGGSIRIVGALEGTSRPVQPSVAEILAEEAAAGVREEQVYQEWDSQVLAARDQLLATLQQARRDGKRAVGFGASHSTTTLSYHFGLGPHLQYLVDDNERKHGLFSPGLGLPVRPTEFLKEDQSDIVVVLAWQHQESILTRWSDVFPDITWIVPLPELRTI